MTREEQIRLEEKLVRRGESDLSALTDAFEYARVLNDHERTAEIRKLARQHFRTGGSKALDVYHRSLIFDGPVSFDCFMRALEFNRPPKEQFWMPRRDKLLPVCRDLQDMEDGKLDELFLSCPPRIGKSTLMMFFFLWVMGRDSERSNLYCSYTDSVVGVLYNGILEVLNDSITYAYGDVFPNKTVASTNAKDLLINLDRKKRYASFTGRSLYGTLNGACDCNGYLVGDDLISGIEEAMSKDRLNNAWMKVDNNMVPRAKEQAKILWIGTRWSIVDPQGKRIDLLENDPKYSGRRWKVRNTPALNEQDESNFEYKYSVGFSSEYYQQRRASFERNNDLASWFAQYQGRPIEREGAVFDPDGMRYFNGVLPEDVDPDRIFMAVDPAWGGGDFVAGPVIYQYGDDLYVADVVYNNGDKQVTQPEIVELIKKHDVQAVYIEATKTTSSYTQEVDNRLKKENLRVNVQSSTKHYTGTGKEQRIFDKAPEIREHMLFLSAGNRSKAYEQFMQNVYSFTFSKKNKHDDAPDSLAMAMSFALFGGSTKAEVFKRPW